MANRWLGGVARLRAWRRLVEFTLARRFGLATREDRLFFLLIPLVGVLAGILGVTVHRLIHLLRSSLWYQADSFLEAVVAAPGWWVVAILAAGGLLVGFLVWLAGESLGGGGVPLLVESVVLSQGRVPPRPVLWRALGAIVTVGSGGSLGREGPMIRLGAMISSWAASRLGLSPQRVKVLVGCGAAAGLAAAYNIPIGATLFAMEVILGNFALEIFGPVVISSVISTLIVRGFEGDRAVYASPGYQLASGWEILAYAGLGVVGALVSIAFILGVKAGGRFFERLPLLHSGLRPLVGMSLVGLCALWFPYILGGGVETINAALRGELTLGLLLVLPLVKLVATALTAGSGGAGGLFTPSLCCGALVGGAYGYGMQTLWPGISESYGAYAIVGMAAVAAGTSHAPISAILILFEFTGDYSLILPLMVSAILSSLLARRLYTYSIYTEPLQRRGIDLSWRMEEAVLAGLRVGDLLRRDDETLKPEDNYLTVVERFLKTRRQRLFVVGAGDHLLGAISLHDIKHALDDPATLTAVVAHDLMVPVDVQLHRDQRLSHAAEAFAHSDYERLPVVDGPQGPFSGHLSKRDLLAIYAQEVLRRPALLATFVSSDSSEAGRDYVELPPDFSVRLLRVPDALVGKTLAEAQLPQSFGVRVIQIKRPTREGEELVIPDAATVLSREDGLILLGPAAALAAFERGEVVGEDSAADRTSGGAGSSAGG